jgi:hypothetical protein
MAVIVIVGAAIKKVILNVNVTEALILAMPVNPLPYFLQCMDDCT